MANMGTNIKNCREKIGMTQEQLAERIGKTRSAVSQYESGKIVPRMGVVEDLANALMVNKNEIIGTEPVYNGLTGEESELVSLFRKLNGKQRAALLDTARAMVV